MIIANPLYGLPLLLYGVGVVFIFGGIAWAALVRKSRSIPSLPSLLSEEDVADRIRSMKGVEAIFSPYDSEKAHRRWGAWTGRISGRLIADLVEIGLLLILYVGFVDEYSSNLFFRSWVHANVPWAAYLLNFYALLTVAGFAGILLGWLVHREQLERLRS